MDDRLSFAQPLLARFEIFFHSLARGNIVCEHNGLTLLSRGCLDRIDMDIVYVPPLRFIGHFYRFLF